MRLCRKRKLCTLLVGIRFGTATVKKSMDVPLQVKILIPYDLIFLLQGIYPKEEKKTLIQKDTCIPMFTAA